MVMSSVSSRVVSEFKSERKLNWDVNSSDESGDEEHLTSLVRNSYMKHLKHCLSKNYERWSKSNISVDELNFCSEMMEKKALRTCMVTSIYQRTMAQIVKEIKEATQNEMLYEGFQKKLALFENKKIDKETQTIIEELKTKKNINLKEEILLNNNSNSSFSNSKTLFLETFGESEATINKKLEQDINGTDSYEELLNILLSSPKNENTSVNSNLNELQSNVKENSSLCKKRKLLNGNHESLPETNNTLIKLEVTKPECQRVSLENLEISSDNNTLQLTDESFNCTRINTSEEKKPRHTFKSNSQLLNWSYELLVQNTHLENILFKLKPHKRVIVEKRFKDLFGNEVILQEDTEVSKISEVELSSCRKRVARIVVGELTPFYAGGQINSRPVFKSLAKKLTDDILCTTFTPEPESIRNTIRGLFTCGKQINSLKDIFHLTS